MPLHSVAIANMGVHLIDNMNLEGLVTACRERNQYEFLFTLAPLRLERRHGLAGEPARDLLGGRWPVRGRG